MEKNSTTPFGEVFAILTGEASRYTPGPLLNLDQALPLMTAAVRFTCQLASCTAEWPHTKGQELELELIGKLATQAQEGRLWMLVATHDVYCVIRDLAGNAQRYAKGLEIFHRNLAIAAVALTAQFAIEWGTVTGIRDLEIALISRLQGPWKWHVETAWHEAYEGGTQST